MSFAPVLAGAGYGGWTFLQRTIGRQQAAFAADPAQRREEAYFRDRIGSVRTAGDLVADRRLLRVALGAFGLEADINSTAFVRKVLEDGTLAPSALANRLADRRYREFSAAFGFGDFATPRTVLSDFPDRILWAYRDRQFAAAVGTQDNDMRLALNAEAELADLAGTGRGEVVGWLSIIGSPPLRKVFETAFGLPAAFGAIDIDRQVATLRDKAGSALGSDSVTQFADPAARNRLLRRFFARSATGAQDTGAGSAALALLTAAARRR